MSFICSKHLARDDCCIGGLSLAGPNRYCNPTTALLAFVPPSWPQVEVDPQFGDDEQFLLYNILVRKKLWLYDAFPWWRNVFVCEDECLSWVCEHCELVTIIHERWCRQRWCFILSFLLSAPWLARGLSESTTEDWYWPWLTSRWLNHFSSSDGGFTPLPAAFRFLTRRCRRDYRQIGEWGLVAFSSPANWITTDWCIKSV